MSKDFRRTKIRSLEISGYRSLKDVKLENLGEIVVLHGPNGSGKSNILRAIDRVIHWATLQNFPTPKSPLTADLSSSDYHKQIKLRPEDFAFGFKQIKIRMEIELGEFQAEFLGAGAAFSTLTLEAIAQDRGQELWVWFEVLRLDHLDLLVFDGDREEGAKLEHLYKNISTSEEIARKYEMESVKTIGQNDGTRVSYNSTIRNLHQHEKEKEKLEKETKEETLLKVRAKSVLLPRLLLHLGAYRTGTTAWDYGNSMQQQRLVQEKDLIAYLAASQIAKARWRRELGMKLSEILNKAGFQQIQLAPIWDSVSGQFELLAKMENGQEHAVSVAGTGKQQLVWMFTNMYVNRAAIVMIEEPEAHLHRKMALELAGFFKREMEPEGENDTFVINQLWLETHHHAFALSPFYLDVSMNKDGWTEVRKERRSRAIEHFYEPSPFWDALRQLVEEAISEDDVVFQGADGRSVTAKMLKDSIEGEDRTLANEYARAMTEMAILAMRRSAKKGAK